MSLGDPGALREELIGLVEVVEEVDELVEGLVELVEELVEGHCPGPGRPLLPIGRF